MRALVVDDAQVQRRFVALVLSEFRDLQVDEANNGVEALRLLRERSYDVVLLDLNLPQMGGVELLDNIRGAASPNSQTPVVVISTQADERTVAQCKELGAVKFLAKPVPAVRIRDAIRDVLQAPVLRAPADGAEKRRVPRLAIPVTVRFENESPMDATTVDISPFGAFIQAPRWKPVGTEATMAILLPHLQAPLVVSCKVVHVRPSAIGALPQGFGVRFSTERPEDLARLVRAFTTPEE